MYDSTDAAELKENPVARLNKLAVEIIEKQKEWIVKLGGTVEDDEGGIVPQPVTAQDKLMFAAGTLSLALFLKGATTL